MEIKVGEIYIVKGYIKYNIDKIISIDDWYIITDYQGPNKYVKNWKNLKSNFKPIYTIYEYFQNPNKYPEIDYDFISKLWEKFVENDIVEARKWKLKLLENYGNK